MRMDQNAREASPIDVDDCKAVYLDQPDPKCECEGTDYKIERKQILCLNCGRPWR